MSRLSLSQYVLSEQKQNDTTLYKQLKYTYFETYNNGKLISELGNISDGGDQLSVFIDYIGVQ